MKNHFTNSDLDITYSRWDVGNQTEYVLPHLCLDKKLMILKVKNNKNTRIDFMLVDINGLLIFHELNSNQKYGFDISEINQDKIYIRLDSGKIGSVWKRKPLESIGDLLKLFD
jgi:hypothetical protein